MIKRILILSVITVSCFYAVDAQLSNLGFGFRAGMSFSKLSGPYETGPGGADLESFSFANGFHIGAAVNFKFTDLVGLHTELIFSQRGTEYEYVGPSYFVLGRNEVQTTTILGQRRQTYNVSNAFIDIPVTLYYKLGSLEVMGGLNAGLLVSSTAGGNIEFTGEPDLTGTSPSFEVNLQYNYFGDEAGEVFGAIQEVTVDGKKYNVPTAAGAYYDFTQKDKALFKSLDFGLVAGLAYFLNDGLFVSGRYIYGLGDVDRNEYDFSLQPFQGSGPVKRDDVNKNHTMQFSIGFSF
jgi:hypothetical protein